VAYRIEPTELFKRESKRLTKEYRSLVSELQVLSQELKENPHLGTDLGFGLFKIRLGIRSKGKGKSGGGRVVTYVIDEDQVVHLLTMYDKSEFDTIATPVLRELARELIR
jgi:mRNA-degrading endonuclease RelE of RelBE toxin-antitoxin system